MVSVPESLLESAANSIEMANNYIAALRKIINAQVKSEEALQLQKIAREAIEQAENTMILGQNTFEE